MSMFSAFKCWCSNDQLDGSQDCHEEAKSHSDHQRRGQPPYLDQPTGIPTIPSEVVVMWRRPLFFSLYDYSCAILGV